MKSQVDTIKMIKTDEGLRLVAYQCEQKVWTLGYGHTKGVEKGDTCTKAQAEAWFMDDLVTAICDAHDLFPTLHRLSHNRQAVLISMSFQMGHSRLSGFKDTIRAVASSKFADAALEMMDSSWARQTPERAKRLAKLMSEG